MNLSAVSHYALAQLRTCLGEKRFERVESHDARLTKLWETPVCIMASGEYEFQVGEAMRAMADVLKGYTLIGTLPFDLAGDYVIGECVFAEGFPVPRDLSIRARSEPRAGGFVVHLQVLAG